MLKQSFQGKVQVTTYLQEHLPEESRSDKSSWQIPANRSRVMKRKLLNTSDALNLQFQSSKNLGSSSWENGYQCSLHCIVWPLLPSFVNGFRGWYNTTFHRPLDTRSAGFPTPTPLHPHYLWNWNWMPFLSVCWEIFNSVSHTKLKILFICKCAGSTHYFQFLKL